MKKKETEKKTTTKKQDKNIETTKKATRKTTMKIKKDDKKSLKESRKEKALKEKTPKKVKTPKAKDKNKNRVFVYRENMTLKEVADGLGISPAQIIQKLFALGQLSTINTPLDKETVELIIVEGEYDVEFKLEAEVDSSRYDEVEEKDDPKDLKKRAPIITIMGHVDHGKTTLLDTIRKTNVAIGESGGITQHIGAYQVKRNNEYLTFVDTPGHAAFTEMRARGAEVTDIVILVVAADDGIKPQTKEAIDHAKAAKVPIIVAINKIDKPTAKVEQTKTKLSEIGIVPEEWGGKHQFVEISAKKGTNITKLLDTILLVAEMLELKANPNKLATGTVVEARLDKGRGPVITVIVKAGTLKRGDFLVIGNTYGKVRTLTNDKGETIKEAIPSQPVEITGIQDVPEAGDKFKVFKSEKEAKAASEIRLLRQKEKEQRQGRSLEAILKDNKEKNLNLIIKADVKGSIEAISNLLENIAIDDIKINIVSESVGSPSENDISLAITTNAIIIAFNTKTSASMKKLAKERDVEIRQYDVIYQIEDDIKLAVKGLLEPTFTEIVIGEAVVRDTFKIPKVGMVAGVYIKNGVARSKAHARIYRQNALIYKGKVSSLKHLKDDKKEVQQGLEAGVMVMGYNDFKVDDVIEFYELRKDEI